MAQSSNADAATQAGELQTQYPNLTSVLLDAVPSSVLILDRGLRVTLANRNFLEKAHRTLGLTVGHRLEEVFPAAILTYTQLDQRARTVFQTGQSYDGGKMTYRAPGVPQRIYYYSLAPLFRVNAVTGVLLMMHDVTEQDRLTEGMRRVERHLASVVESANDLVVSMEPDGRILTWNQAAERVSGFHVAEVTGRYLPHLCVPEQQAEMRELLAAVERGEAGKVCEIGLQTREDALAGEKTGKSIPVAWACSPMWDDSGRVTALVVVGRDLTERRLLEAELLQSAKMASLGVMAGGIAHQLRNPLGAASAAAQLLLREPENLALGRECAHKIYEGIKRASDIIESLLRFARPDHSQSSPVAINQVIGDTVAMMQHQANLSQIKVEQELASDLPLVLANHSALQQVFTNLTLNSCQAMPTGGKLLIRTRLSDSGSEIAIDFVDTGCGIAEGDLNRIFDPFFTTRPVGQGVGLGLTIAYSLVQQHAGNIQVHSLPAAGSTFTVILPAVRPGYERNP